MIDTSSWSAIPDRSISILYADPPWHYGHTEPTRDPARKYPTLHVYELAEMRPSIDRVMSKSGGGLFLWTTGTQLRQAMRLLEAWDFEYKTMAFTWIKLSKQGFPFFGLGRYTRSAAEFVLFATKYQNPKPKVRNIRQTVETVYEDTLLSPRLRHSEKPEEVRARIETLFDGPYFELFARREVEGWWSWGNELPGALTRP